MATLIAQATGTDVTSGLTAVLTAGVPSNGILVAAWCCGNTAHAFADQFHISAASDPSSVTWSLNHNGANVGAVGDQSDGTWSAAHISCYAGSATRACTHGDLSPGDSVHLTENASSYPTDASWALAIVHIAGVSNTAVAWEDPVGGGSAVDYNNELVLSSQSPDGVSFNYGTTETTFPHPISDSVMVAIAGSYPGKTWTPLALTKAAEVVGGSAVAVNVKNVAAGGTAEEGGSFSTGPDAATLGFQFALGTEPAVLHLKFP